MLTVHVCHRGLILLYSCLDLDKHQNSLLSSVIADQTPGSVTLSNDRPTYSQCTPLLSVCVHIWPSLNLPVPPVASMPLYPADLGLYSPPTCQLACAVLNFFFICWLLGSDTYLCRSAADSFLKLLQVVVDAWW